MKKYHYIVTVLVLALLVAPIAHADDDGGRDGGFFRKLFKIEDRKAEVPAEVKLEDRNRRGSDDENESENEVEHGITRTSSGTIATTGVRMELRTEKALAELDRRISSLQKLQTRIEAMTRVSDANKASLKTTITTQISALTTLKAKIAADTDEAILKADIASITNTYRIYALVLPQMTILAAGDRVASTIELMTTFAGKLEARIAEAKTAGKDVTALETADADLKTQLSEAKVNADAALALVVNLQPDNGDKTIMEANKKALTDARAKIRAAQADLKSARKDAETIVKGLKAMNITVDAKIKAEKSDSKEKDN